MLWNSFLRIRKHRIFVTEPIYKMTCESCQRYRKHIYREQNITHISVKLLICIAASRWQSEIREMIHQCNNIYGDRSHQSASLRDSGRLCYSQLSTQTGFLQDLPRLQILHFLPRHIAHNYAMAAGFARAEPGQSQAKIQASSPEHICQTVMKVLSILAAAALSSASSCCVWINTVAGISGIF